jgi:hypothetical protein
MAAPVILTTFKTQAQGTSGQLALSPAAAQATSNPSPRMRPLDDFVPCLFNSDEQYENRTLKPLPPPPNRISADAAEQITENTATALQQALEALGPRAATQPSAKGNNKGNQAPQGGNQQQSTSTLSADIKGYVDAVIAKYKEGLQDKLVNSTPEQAQAAIVNAAREALKSAMTSDRLDVQEFGQKALKNVDLNNVAAAGVPPQKFPTPEDVSCSMSILSWKETSDTFGRRVANTYIALQVTIRNLNTTNEFLVHDIQVAVDTGVSLYTFSRFQAGRDKLLVRAVAERGQAEDRRNLALHSLQAVGAIVGSASIVGGPSFQAAVAVFQGAFIPGFATLFPDHTVAQLNHINDLAFSASSTSKTLVPIQGSVPLVTFIPARPIEQMPFAWCGHNQQDGKQEYCEAYGYADGIKSSVRSSYPDDYIVNGVKHGRPQDKNGNLDLNPQSYYQVAWDELEFKKWKGAALHILQERTYVVVGGVHIKELTKQPAKISSIKCPSLPSGAFDISDTTDGFATCAVTGSDLDTVASVSLKKDNEKIGGRIKAAKDGNSADLQFDPSLLADSQGIYALFLVDKSGSETDSGESVLLEAQPLITSAGGSLDLGKTPAMLAVKGKHLDLLRDVSLVPDDSTGPPINEVAAAKSVVPPTPSPEPAKPQPIKPEPVKPEAAKPQPAEPQPVKPEAAKPQPAKPQPVKPEAAKPQPAKPEPVKPEPVKPEAAKPQPAKAEPVKPEAPKPEPVKPEAAKVEPAAPPASSPRGSIPAGATSASICFDASGQPSAGTYHLQYATAGNPKRVDLKSIKVKVTAAVPAAPEKKP